VQEILLWLQLNTTIEFRHKDSLVNDAEPVIATGVFEEQDYMLPVRINVTRFVALDDIDMRALGERHARLLIARHHFVLTMMSTGVTAHNLEQARHILSDQYGAVINMLSTTDNEKKKQDNNDDEGMYHLMLPLCHHCEKCGRRDQTPSLYDADMNKYFCLKKCRDEFYLLYCKEQQEGHDNLIK
jgi:hypothetical protein